MATKKKSARQGSFRRGPGGARPGLKRATYYLTDDLIMRLKIQAAKEGKDASAILREILDNALGKVV